MAWKVIKTIIIVLCIVFVLMYVTAKAKKGKSIYKDEPKQQNPLEVKKLFLWKTKMKLKMQMESGDILKQWVNQITDLHFIADT